jgi:hypothetical protein
VRGSHNLPILVLLLSCRKTPFNLQMTRSVLEDRRGVGLEFELRASLLKSKCSNA